MNRHVLKDTSREYGRLKFANAVLGCVAIVATFIFIPSASASKQAVDFFGGSGSEGGKFQAAGGVAVNETGAGGVPAGTIYATDAGNFDISSQRGNRIERFQRDNSGTPNDTADDTYAFVSAWGAGVEASGTNYEVCTVAANCRDAVGTGGNGTPAGDGSLSKPSAIAVDQDTGDVYVSDNGPRRAGPESNFRVNVYDAKGAFLRSFGFDVVESGPDDNGVGYEICKAGVDICKSGASGSGAGQLGGSQESVAVGIAVSQPDGNAAAGTVFLADGGNRRIDTYDLDGSSPSTIGSAATFTKDEPESIAVDSRGIVYASNAANENEIERYDSEDADGGGVGFLAPISAPPLLQTNKNREATTGLAVDPDSDGAGPDADSLYVLRNTGGPSKIQQFGPLDPPGLTVPPGTVDDTHATSPEIVGDVGEDLAVEQTTGRLYVAAFGLTADGAGPGVYVLDNVGVPPTASLDSLSAGGSHSIIAHATIDPNGPPDTHYHFEYSTDGTDWSSTADVDLGHQETPQLVEEVIEPALLGLQPNTLYHVRLVVGRRFAEPITTAEQTATTQVEKPIVETTGSPVRTATSADLLGRVTPLNSPTTYYFEYGAEGPCDASPCTVTPSRPAGAGGLTELVSESVQGLQPNTTYHYRVVADNGAPGSPVFGEDNTVTMRASDTPLTHGNFPGPPGSDRAWEQVSIPNSGGNPVGLSLGFSDNGDRAIYGIFGGTPISESGSFLSIYYSERSEQAAHVGGWHTSSITPPRRELVGPNWLGTYARTDLATVVSQNNIGAETNALWRFGPGGQQPAKLFQPSPPQELVQFSDGRGGPAFGISADGSRVIAGLRGGELDPAFPAASSELNLYDITSGSPRLVSLLPDGSAAACGATGPLTERKAQQSHWISPSGSSFFFTSSGNDCTGVRHLYMRDLQTGETKMIATKGSFLKLTPQGAFFVTSESLAQNDTGGADVYRYGLGDESFSCVTCVVPGFSADVDFDEGAAPSSVAVSEDGSRVYFRTNKRLLPGTPSGQSFGLYRVNVNSGNLAYVAPVPAPLGVPVSLGATASGVSISSDGSIFVFRSSAPNLNALGGSTNGGTSQFYAYNDHDRSLTCISCPQDGTSPTEDVQSFEEESGPNLDLLANDGTFAFATTAPLVGADQNTPPGNRYAGTDVYEWRDGRQILVTDGLTRWPAQSAPAPTGISPSGRDIFFTASAQYTPDALDAYIRLYDARIGGGFEFPSPPKPCPLEVCQGTPKGAPEESPPGTSAFAGPGDVGPSRQHSRCPKGLRQVRSRGKVRCEKRHHRMNHNRRTAP
jgi:hypothetical protein